MKTNKKYIIDIKKLNTKDLTWIDDNLYAKLSEDGAIELWEGYNDCPICKELLIETDEQFECICGYVEKKNTREEKYNRGKKELEAKLRGSINESL